MCTTCGCGSKAEPKILNLQTGTERELRRDHAAPDEHVHSHPHDHDHHHHHAHEHGHAHVHDHGDGHPHDHEHVHHDHDHHHAHDHATSVVDLEARILAKNDRLAARNRGWFEGREILALNLVSSPGAGKTTLLERTIRDLKAEASIFVIEGDQATANDGERIRAAGAAAIQVNTGTGCHLEADMVAKGLEELKPPAGALVLIENVGNLVCPALFDLGERAKVIVLSVTEGEDKPLKYPHIFQAADLMIINKSDLLPYVDFNIATAIANARAVNPNIETVSVSARSGDGMSVWYEWVRRHQGDDGQSSFGRPVRPLENSANHFQEGKKA
jgi:hydrogenase nickel incorporation protein HypB